MQGYMVNSVRCSYEGEASLLPACGNTRVVVLDYDLSVLGGFVPALNDLFEIIQLGLKVFTAFSNLLAEKIYFDF